MFVCVCLSVCLSLSLSLSVYIYIYIFVCMYVCMYVCMQVWYDKKGVALAFSRHKWTQTSSIFFRDTVHVEDCNKRSLCTYM